MMHACWCWTMLFVALLGFFDEVIGILVVMTFVIQLCFKLNGVYIFYVVHFNSINFLGLEDFNKKNMKEVINFRVGVVPKKHTSYHGSLLFESHFEFNIWLIMTVHIVGFIWRLSKKNQVGRTFITTRSIKLCFFRKKLNCKYDFECKL